MISLKDAFEALDNIKDEVSRHAGYAIADLNQAVENVGYHTSIYLDPSTLRAIEEFGKAARQHVGTTSDDIWKALLGAGIDFGTRAKPFIEGLEASISGAGQDVHKYLSGAIADARLIKWVNLPTDIKAWIEKNPERTIGIILSILLPVIAGSLAAAAVPTILAAFGFTTEGILAGSIAAKLHSGIGDVAANTLFSTLMSAGAAGAGLATVETVVGGLSSVIASAGSTGIVVDLLGSAGIGEEKKEKCMLE